MGLQVLHFDEKTLSTAKEQITYSELSLFVLLSTCIAVLRSCRLKSWRMYLSLAPHKDMLDLIVLRQ